MANTDKNLGAISQDSASVLIELKEEQLESVLERLQQKPSRNSLDIWNKRLDIVQKVLISFGAGLLSVSLSAYIGWQEFGVKQSEFQAKSFAGLFAEKRESRLEAAAAAINGLHGDRLESFLRLASAHFDDATPLAREYARQFIVDMASTCYERENKLPIIVNVMAERLDKEEDQATKKRAAEIAGQIRLPTSKLLTAANTLLSNHDEGADVVAEVCNTIGSLKWSDSSAHVFTTHIVSLRGTLDSLAQDPKHEGLQKACGEALQKLPK